MHVNVTVIGLNRVSASLALALKRYQKQPNAEHTFAIIGNDAKAQPMKAAEKIGAVDNFHRQMGRAVDNADLIIMNAPVSDARELLSRLGPDLKHGAVVLDMSELKQPGIAASKQFFPTNSQGQLLAYLVGITPIVNAEKLYTGSVEVEDASADLFDGSEFMITPDVKCPGEAIALAEDVVRLIGARPRFMDPGEHDGLIAATEGLPALLGVALFRMLNQSEGWLELRRMVNPAMALAIQNFRYQTHQDQHLLFTQNRENLVRHLESFIGTLDEMRDLLADPERSEELEIFLSRTQSEWEKWDVKRHSGNWEETREPSLGPVGLMGGLLNMGGMRRQKKNDED